MLKTKDLRALLIQSEWIALWWSSQADSPTAATGPGQPGDAERAVGTLYLRLLRRVLTGSLSLSSGSAFWMLRASRMTSRQDASST
jgi:hypothetical protein